MKEIVVISGKGGTGKTVITSALAYAMGDRCVVADCDVDAADMHLIFKPMQQEETDFYSGEEPEMAVEHCIQCGLCVEKCRFGAIKLSEDSIEMDPFACEGCGLCARICPQGAITMKSRYVGASYVSTIRTGTVMAHARLLPGGENSGKLVAHTKKIAREQAETKGLDIILVDGSPGIGCPVISSLSGATYVLLVTEATESAFHDMKRVIELVKKFRIPVGCIINKHDLNPDLTKRVEQYLLENAIPTLGMFEYDEAVQHAVKAGKTINEYAPGRFKDRIEMITDRILNEEIK